MMDEDDEYAEKRRRVSHPTDLTERTWARTVTAMTTDLKTTREEEQSIKSFLQLARGILFCHLSQKWTFGAGSLSSWQGASCFVIWVNREQRWWTILIYNKMSRPRRFLVPDVERRCPLQDEARRRSLEEVTSTCYGYWWIEGRTPNQEGNTNLEQKRTSLRHLTGILLI